MISKRKRKLISNLETLKRLKMKNKKIFLKNKKREKRIRKIRISNLYVADTIRHL